MQAQNMTDDEIIKALECCSSVFECHNGCPYYNNGEFKCRDLSFYKDTLDLINRQKAEIEVLKKDNEWCHNLIVQYNSEFVKQEAEIERLKKGWKADILLTTEAKSEAVKEFAERLKEQAKNNEWNGTICGVDIDNLLKEMVGDNNEN